MKKEYEHDTIDYRIYAETEEQMKIAEELNANREFIAKVCALPKEQRELISAIIDNFKKHE